MKKENFKNPPVESRPAPFWSWNDNFTAEELVRQIKEMSEKGWGSFFMHSRVGLVTPYLKDEWFKLANVCCEAAKNEHINANLYDEDKWPSGFAGGEIVKNKKFRQRALCFIDKKEMIDDDKILCEYDGRVIVRRIVPLGCAWFNGYCYADLMNKDAIKAFLDSTHEKYAQKCGKYFGNVIQGVFTDEPCYSMYDLSGRGGGKCDFLPWTDKLPQTFEANKGYSLIDNLPLLFVELDGYEKIRFDFFDTILNMFIDAFTKPYAEWCKEHSLALTGHFMCEDSLLAQVSWTGASMPHYEYMQRPGIDKLGRNVNPIQTVKQLTSVSEQFEKERNLSEVFGCMGHQGSFFHRKWIAQWQAVLGIDFVNHHLSLYSMRGERKRDYPANLFYQQPWWDEEKPFSDYVGRMCEYVHSTKRDVDILVIHPVTTAWCLFEAHNTLNKLPQKINLYDREFSLLSENMIAEKLDFHYGDETIMEKHASVKGNTICIGGFAYHIIVLPPMLNLTHNTLQILNKFAANGGKIICQAPYVQLVDGNRAAIEFLANATMTANRSETIESLDQCYPDRIKITDTIANANANSIFAEHKYDEDNEYYFIVSNEENRSLNTQISIKTDKNISVLDFSDGKTYALATTDKGGRKYFDAKLYPAGSMLLCLSDKNDASLHTTAFIGSGVEFIPSEKYAQAKITSAKLCEENVLVLENATLTLGGKLIAENAPLNTLWHTHFYPAENGTPFKAEYTFHVDSMPDGELTAAIEMAQNLDKITFNGKELALPTQNLIFDDTCYKDLNFRKVALGKPVVGTNTLVIEGKKVNNISDPGCHVPVADNHSHKPTELEAIYVTGNFSVCSNDDIHFAMEAPHAPCNKNIVASGCPFYAGKVDIEIEFDADGKLPSQLMLEGVDAACVRLSVNGVDCGIRYWDPFVYDISEAVHSGKNIAVATLSTTLVNMMGPNRVKDVKRIAYVSPHTFSNTSLFTEKYDFFNYGIKGAMLLK